MAPGPSTRRDEQPAAALSASLQAPSAATVQLIDESGSDGLPPHIWLSRGGDNRTAVGGQERESPLGAAFVDDIITRFGVAATVNDTLTEPIDLNIPRRAQNASFIARAIDPEFEDDGTTRTLRAVLDPSDSHRVADTLDRLELARLAAMALAVLHDADVVTSGVDLGTFAVVLRPRPRLVLVQPDRLRPLGGEPLDGSVPLRGIDEDRRDLAELIALVLSLDAAPEDNPVRRALSTSSLQEATRLLERSRSGRGGSPTAKQWAKALTA
ncbi:hypothetical protein [Nocardioides ultimimeridianus]